MSAFPITSRIVRYASAATDPVRSGLGAARRAGGLDIRLRALDLICRRWLLAHSITILRMSLGAVFLAFGALKFFPGVSPAQDLVERTTDALTFGLVPGGIALVVVATLECVVGLCLLSGRAVPLAVCLLGILLVGILSPLVLLTGRLFAGPHGAPTLEGQYVLKDVILVGAALVVAATCRGGRLTAPNEEHELGPGAG
jgi:uncharacterized membrane protein YphA (DoxX/SURF4 family)